VRLFAAAALAFGSLALTCASDEANESRSASFSGPTVTLSRTLEPGWTRFAVDGLEVALPDRFDGGDVDEDLDSLEEAKAKIVDQARGSLDVIRELDAFRLFAFDAEAGPGDYVTNVSVLAIPMIDATTTELLTTAKERYVELEGFTVVHGEVMSLVSEKSLI
jgi:hypothetical protein